MRMGTRADVLILDPVSIRAHANPLLRFPVRRSPHVCEEAIVVVDKEQAVIGRKIGVREVYVLFQVKMPVPDMHGTSRAVVWICLVGCCGF